MTKSSNNSKYIGFTSLILAAFIFSLYGIFSRYISSDFGPFYQTVSRYFISIILLFILALISKSLKPVKKSDKKYFFIQAFFGAFVNVPFFLSVNNLPLGTALFLFYASSTIGSYLFGFFILKEKISVVKITALLFALSGIMLIYKDSFLLFRSFYILTAISAGGFFGLYTSSSKLINLKYSSLQINLIEYPIIFLLTLPFVIIGGEHVFLNIFSFSWMINFIYAVAVVATGLLIVYGFKYFEAQIGSLVLLSELVFVVALGFLFFKEIPSLFTIVGGMLILVSLAIPNLKFNKLRQEWNHV